MSDHAATTTAPLARVDFQNSAPSVGTSSSERSERPWTTFLLVAVGSFMTMLDASIVNISLPSIARTFHASIGSGVEWVIIAYLVTIATTLLTFGRLSDIIGRKPVWLLGLALFSVGSALCGAAPSLQFLIAARVFQGIGGALLFSTSVAIITETFPAHRRGFALGCNAVVIALGSSVGPVLGGLITGHWNWRWIFYINLPIGLCGLIGSIRVLRHTLGTRAQGFDPLGAVFLALGFGPLTLALSFLQEWGWSSWQSLLCFGTTALALIAVPAVERRVVYPIIDLRLLTNRVFASALLSMTLAMLALFAVGFMLPFYFEELRGFSVAKSGLFLTVLPLTLALVAPASGLLSDHFGSRWLASAGLAIACGGLVFLAQLGERSPAWAIIGPLAIIGMGQGLFATPNARALMNAAPASEQGESSGLLATGRVLGQSLSVALAGAIFTGLTGAQAGSVVRATGFHHGAADQTAVAPISFVAGFHTALLVCAGIAAVGALAALTRGSEGNGFDPKRKTLEP